MNIPCCRGLERAVKAAAESCGKALNVETAVVSREGRILRREESWDTDMRRLCYMFCFQCEQTANCAGVCGKKAETALLQDLCNI